MEIINKNNVNYFKIFLRYLKYFDIYKKYMENIDDKIFIRNFKNEVTPTTSLIDYAFCWSDTKEGFSFWCDVDDVWAGIHHHIRNKLHANEDNTIKYDKLTQIFQSYYNDCPF